MDDGLVDRVGKRIGDTSDLPEELRKIINVSKSMDDLEEKVVATIRNRYGGIASIDEIIVGLYRDFKYLADDRRKFAGKLYRMTKSGYLEGVPKRKGVFRLK